jgi:hypothetical protein
MRRTTTKLMAAILASTVLLGVAAADAGKRRIVKFHDKVSISLVKQGSSEGAAGAVTSLKGKCTVNRTVTLFEDPQTKNDPSLFVNLGSTQTNSAGQYFIPIAQLSAADSFFVKIRLLKTRHKVSRCLAAYSPTIHK